MAFRPHQEETNVAKLEKNRSIAAGRKNPEAERAADGNAGASEKQRVEREMHHQARERACWVDILPRLKTRDSLNSLSDSEEKDGSR